MLAGMFGTVGKTGRLQAHDAMITCLDASDTNMILSAGMDTRILRWDFRTLANQVPNCAFSQTLFFIIVNMLYEFFSVLGSSRIWRSLYETVAELGNFSSALFAGRGWTCIDTSAGRQRSAQSSVGWHPQYSSCKHAPWSLLSGLCQFSAHCSSI